jgi:hypothetical protein
MTASFIIRSPGEEAPPREYETVAGEHVDSRKTSHIGKRKPTQPISILFNEHTGMTDPSEQGSVPWWQANFQDWTGKH